MVVRLVLGALFSLNAASATAQDWFFEVYGMASGPDVSPWQIRADDDSRGAGMATYWSATPWLQLGADVMTSTHRGVEPGDAARTKSLMAAGRLKIPLGKADVLVGLGYGVVDVMYHADDNPTRRSLAAGQVSFGAQVPSAGGAVFGEIKHREEMQPADADARRTDTYEGDFAVLGYQFNF